MSLGYRCDRCGAFGDARYGEQREPGPYPPEDWLVFTGPVRGSTGAKSVRSWTICAACDDALYQWLTNPSVTR